MSRFHLDFPGLTLYLSALFCCYSAALGFLCLAAQVASKPFKSRQYSGNRRRTRARVGGNHACIQHKFCSGSGRAKLRALILGPATDPDTG